MLEPKTGELFECNRSPNECDFEFVGYLFIPKKHNFSAAVTDKDGDIQEFIHVSNRNPRSNWFSQDYRIVRKKVEKHRYAIKVYDNDMVSNAWDTVSGWMTEDEVRERYPQAYEYKRLESKVM